MNDALYNWLFYGTALLLVAAVAALEVYRLRAGRPGRIRRFTCGQGAFGLGEARAEVELEDGRVVEARVPGCTQCLCRLRPGDAVVVTTSAGQFVVGTAVGRGGKRSRASATVS